MAPMKLSGPTYRLARSRRESVLRSGSEGLEVSSSFPCGLRRSSAPIELVSGLPQVSMKLKAGSLIRCLKVGEKCRAASVFLSAPPAGDSTKMMARHAREESWSAVTDGYWAVCLSERNGPVLATKHRLTTTHSGGIFYCQATLNSERASASKQSDRHLDDRLQ